MLFPVDFGAVGDGITDDSAALQACLDAAVAASIGAPMGGGAPGRVPIVDLGGLAYAVGTQLNIGANVGLWLRNGTLQATASFPATDFLLTAGEVGTPYASGFRIENLRVTDVNFRCEHRGGGFYLARYIRAIVERCAFFGYTSYGLQLAVDGHECYVTNSQFGEYVWGESGYDNAAGFVGTGVQIDTPDNHFTNVVVQLSAVGMVVNDQANLFSQVHIWPGYVWDGTSLVHQNTGLVVKAGMSYNFFSSCYFDGGPVILENPWMTSFVGCFFLHGRSDSNRAFIYLKPTMAARWIHGLVVTGCQFRANDGAGAMKMFDVDLSAGGSFLVGNTTDCLVDGNGTSGLVKTLHTHPRRRLYQNGATVWTFDFSNELPFGTIQWINYSVLQHSGPPATFSLAYSGSTVTVTASAACEATVYAEIDVNNRT